MGIAGGRVTLLAVLSVLGASAVAGTAEARPTETNPADEPKYGEAAEQRPVCVKPQKKAELCVHWVKKGEHAATKGQAKLTAATFKAVWKREVIELGFRAPLRDKEGGFKQKHVPALDVYLANVGLDGVEQGHCTPTAPATKQKKFPDARAAYCIVDDDFAEFASESLSAEEALQATAAHEFFHAVQYAYDRVAEPGWLIEGTAVWMEEQVYPAINESHDYLDSSPLASPEMPLDAGGAAAPLDATLAPFQYGAWIFWQFLTEYQPEKAIVRGVWETAATGAANDTTDVRGAVSAVTGFTFGSLLNYFGAWNYRVGAPSPLSYAEGPLYLEALLGRRPPLDAGHSLSAQLADTGLRGITLAPLATGYVRITNGGGTPCLFTVSVDFPPTANARDAGWFSESAGGFGPWELFPVSDPGSVQGQVAPGSSVILVLSNSTDPSPAAYLYRATAAC